MNIKEKFCIEDCVDQDKISKIVTEALCGSDGGELFLESCQFENLSIEDGIIRNIDFNSYRGFGFRSFVGEKTHLVCSSKINEEEILKAASLIRNTNNTTKGCGIVHLEESNRNLYTTANPLEEILLANKIETLKNIDTYIRSKNNYVKQVKSSISGQWQVIHIIRSDGSHVSDIRPLVRLNISVVLEKNGRKEQGSFGHGGRALYSDFIKEKDWQNAANEALRQALVNLEAVPAPAGAMTVVLGPGWPGVLLHEAIGHGLESDFNRKKVSAFSDLIGERVAAKGITVVDDGTILNRRGSINIDDEGTPSAYNVLIDDGVLVGYMHDNMNAQLMKEKSTGNGRRQSYKDVVMPRMTNTYMLPGNDDPQDIISSVKYGVYAVNFGGGQVDITSGKFVFSASESYLIENGEVTRPIKGTTLIGNGPDVLKKVSMIGNDMKLDLGVGTCSKNGQDVPVGVGQPTLRVDKITVGGTEC